MTQSDSDNNVSLRTKTSVWVRATWRNCYNWIILKVIPMLIAGGKITRAYVLFLWLIIRNYFCIDQMDPGSVFLWFR